MITLQQVRTALEIYKADPNNNDKRERALLLLMRYERQENLSTMQVFERLQRMEE